MFDTKRVKLIKSLLLKINYIYCETNCVDHSDVKNRGDPIMSEGSLAMRREIYQNETLHLSKMFASDHYKCDWGQDLSIFGGASSRSTY